MSKIKPLCTVSYGGRHIGIPCTANHRRSSYKGTRGCFFSGSRHLGESSFCGTAAAMRAAVAKKRSRSSGAKRPQLRKRETISPYFALASEEGTEHSLAEKKKLQWQRKLLGWKKIDTELGRTDVGACKLEQLQGISRDTR